MTRSDKAQGDEDGGAFDESESVMESPKTVQKGARRKIIPLGFFEETDSEIEMVTPVEENNRKSGKRKSTAPQKGKATDFMFFFYLFLILSHIVTTNNLIVFNFFLLSNLITLFNII
uniref:PEST proteolytic signal-containing nuclear protein n=1 Tax=Strongyloides papillosus TaxID=174720 RepID=A0A0N5C7X8_STREA